MSILAAVLVAANAFADDAKDLRFMSGLWSSQREFGVFHYSLCWTKNEHGNMMGYWRATGYYAGRASINVELLAIEREKDGLILKIKHFDSGKWSESSSLRIVEVDAKDEWQVCRLVSISSNEAVFDNGQTSDQKLRITYRKTGKRLEVTKETIESGKPSVFSLTYKRD